MPINDENNNRIIPLLEPYEPNENGSLSPNIGSTDLKPSVKKKLGDYVSVLTKHNTYPINPGSTEFSLKTQAGNPAPLTNNSDSATDYLKSQQSTDWLKAIALFDKSSASGMLDTDVPFKIRKGLSDDLSVKNGEQYYSEINELHGESEIALRVEQALLENNRFNEKSPIVLPNEREGNARSNLGGLVIQPKLGEHLPKKFSNNGTAKAAEIISVDKLKNFGLITMLQASGEISIPKDLSDPNKSLTTNILALVPGLARIGQRIPVTRFDGVKILNEAFPEFNKDSDSLIPKSDNAVPSYGSPYSPFVPFNSFTNGASQASAVIMSITVSNLLKALAASVNAIQRKNSVDPQQNIIGRIDGQTRTVDADNKSGVASEKSYLIKKGILSIDLVETRNEYYDCLEIGINEFFGFTEAGGSGITNKLINQTSNAVRNSEHINVLLRELLRSSTDLFMQQLNVVDLKLNTNLDIDKTPGAGNLVLNIASNAMNFITQLNNSKLLKFMNILATIGDSVLAQQHILSGDVNFIDRGASDVDFLSDIPINENYPRKPNIAILQMKNRLSDKFSNTLAWNSNTLPSNYLLPQTILNGAELFDGDRSRFISVDGINSIPATLENRLGAQDVQNLEEQLDASYMPFYFHDLRTNEIISFHAFLESMSDSFTAGYNETEGYGRVGKVLTYKNTNRSISMGFSVLATSKTGFDEMWFKINKLLSLLYPQWTEGRVLEYSNERFVQPFSQLPSASPLIRLRLGDVFKSNYSKFNLARLFGLGGGNFSVDTSTNQQATSANNLQRISEVNARILHEMDDLHLYNIGNFALLKPNSNTVPGNTPNRGNRTILSEGVNVYTRVESSTLPITSRALRNNRANTLHPIVANQTKVKIESIENNGESYKISFLNPVPNSNQEGKFIVPKESLLHDPDTVRQLVEQQIPPTPIANSTKESINEFFSINNNPIIKSFESTRGKGLAGFITSFNMDVDQNTVWETDFGSKAPKMIKVTINFEPIHDLNPGIDHNGYMSAPIYNIGDIMNQTSRDRSSTQFNAEKNRVLNNGRVDWRPRGNGSGD